MADPRPRPLVGAPGYTVDVHGNVYSPHGRRLAEQCMDGRLWVFVTTVRAPSGSDRGVPLAPAVLVTFVGLPPDDAERVVVYRDGDASNCGLRNLRWLRAGESTEGLVVQRTDCRWLEVEHA